MKVASTPKHMRKGQKGNGEIAKSGGEVVQRSGKSVDQGN